MRRGGPEGNRKNGTKGSRVIRTFSQTFTTSTKTAYFNQYQALSQLYNGSFHVKSTQKSITSSDFDKTW